VSRLSANEKLANVAEFLLQSGSDDAPAVVEEDRVFSYRRLREDVERLTSALLQRRLRKGAIVGLFSDNSFFFVTAYLAIVRAGLAVCPIPTDASFAIMKEIFASTRMSHLFIRSKFLKRLGDLDRQCGLTLVTDIRLELGNATETLGELIANAADSASPPTIDPNRDLAAVMFTSGSTGRPKGVMVTHKNIRTNTQDIAHYLSLTAADRVMVALPFYYCFGTSLLHSHLMVGGSVALNNQFLVPEQVLDGMVSKNCTNLAGVPSTYQILLRSTSFKQRTFPALRLFQQAGGKLPNALIQEIRETFPKVKFFVMYGQTEATARLSFLPPERLEDKLGSIGRGLPSTSIDVMKKDGKLVTPGSDEVGEIVASGGNISPGYLNDPEETAKYFRQGRLHTGDMARVDEDGFIFIVDREREFVKSMGHRVSPKEIEEVIAEMPEVVEVVVFGAPDELQGEALRALIVPREPGLITEDDVRLHCVRALPNFKVPKSILFVPSIQKNNIGKISKSTLKLIYSTAG